MNTTTEHVNEPLHPAVAAALALPPMTEEEIQAVARILAGIERRRVQRPVEQSNEVA